jgi:hypothetical protein
VPAWAERALISTTALLIAAGITGAVVSDRDSDGRPAARVAREADDPDGTEGTLDPDGDGSGDASIDGDPRRSFADTFDFADEAGAPAGDRPGAAVADVAAQSAGPSPVGGASPTTTPTRPAGDPPTSAPTPSPTTTAPPLLQIELGLGRTVALGLGDCTGLELLGTTAGCPPDTPDDGVTVAVESSLLPG